MKLVSWITYASSLNKFFYRNYVREKNSYKNNENHACDCVDFDFINICVCAFYDGLKWDLHETLQINVRTFVERLSSRSSI